MLTLIFLSLAMTQAVKKGLESVLRNIKDETGKLDRAYELKPAVGWALSFIVTAFVVTWQALTAGAPFNFAFVITFVEVLAGANGAFLLVKKVMER